jgi:uncharacterized protein YndB with AHSA1/START domain
MNEGKVELTDQWPVIRFERQFAQPVERVWAAVTEPAQLAEWLAYADVELHPGGRFELQFHHRDEATKSLGQVTAVETNRMLEFTWYPDKLGDSRVRIELTPNEHGCLLVLTHAFPESYGIPETLGGWHVHLDALRAQLTGEPYDLNTAPWRSVLAHYRGGSSPPAQQSASASRPNRP